MAGVRCGRCGATLEQGQGAVAIVTGAAPLQLPLCVTHAEEVRVLLEHYAAHRIGVLAGNRLCLALTDADSTRRPLREADRVPRETRHHSAEAASADECPP